MKKVFAKIRRAAPSDSTVLLTGESGTGKELAARAIHLLSPRRDKEFVPVDCSALVETLLESELFGTSRGPSPGPTRPSTASSNCQHRHLFFDEITNLSLNIQAKLLRVIQEREFMQVGSQKRIKLDIRIIASSNRDLSEAVKAASSGKTSSTASASSPPSAAFAGAYWRHSPPGGAFSAQILREKQPADQRHLPRSHEAVEQLRLAGQRRELEHPIERIVILEDGDVIQPEHLPASLPSGRGSSRYSPRRSTAWRTWNHVISSSSCAAPRAAARTRPESWGINRKTLGHKIEKYKLRVYW